MVHSNLINLTLRTDGYMTYFYDNENQNPFADQSSIV